MIEVVLRSIGPGAFGSEGYIDGFGLLVWGYADGRVSDIDGVVCVDEGLGG